MRRLRFATIDDTDWDVLCRARAAYKFALAAAEAADEDALAAAGAAEAMAAGAMEVAEGVGGAGARAVEGAPNEGAAGAEAVEEGAPNEAEVVEEGAPNEDADRAGAEVVEGAGDEEAEAAAILAVYSIQYFLVYNTKMSSMFADHSSYYLPVFVVLFFGSDDSHPVWNSSVSYPVELNH